MTNTTHKTRTVRALRTIVRDDIRAGKTYIAIPDPRIPAGTIRVIDGHGRGSLHLARFFARVA